MCAQVSFAACSCLWGFMLDVWVLEGKQMPFTPPILPSSFQPPPTSHPGNRAVTLLLTRSESINTLAPRALSHGTRATGDSSVALQPPRPRQRWHRRTGAAGPCGAGSHALAAVPKVTRQALAPSQSVEPRPKIKKTAREEGREQGADEVREKWRSIFSFI